MAVFLRYLKEKVLNKKIKIFLIISIILFVAIFLTIKCSYLNAIINYANDYIYYYVNKYLGGNYHYFMVSPALPLFIENDVIGILSAPYLYCITHQQLIFNIYLFVLPFIIFQFIHSNFFDELHHGFGRNMILKIGRRRYENYTIAGNCFIGGILSALPKIIYYCFLTIFYYPSYSHEFFIRDYSLINNRICAIFQTYNPISLVIGDIVMSFFCGVTIALISTIIMILSKKKANTYLFFLLIILGQSIIASFLFNITNTYILDPLFFYNSIYFILNNWLENGITIMASCIPIIGLSFILLIITKVLMKRKIKDFV